MKNYLVQTILVISVATFISCKKDPVPKTDPQISGANTQGSLDDFFAANATAQQTFTFNAANATTLVCSKGTTVEVPASAFKTQGGTTVLGTVNVKVRDFYSKKDLILNRLSTVTAADVLLTKGMIQISATQGDESLLMNTAKSLTLSFPTAVTPGNDMLLFQGKTESYNNLQWTPRAGGTMSASPVITPVMSFSVACDTLTWLKIGKANFGAGAKTNFTVTVHGNYNSANTDIFLYFPTQKSIGRLDKPGTQTYSAGWSVPIGTNFTIIAISRVNGRYFYSATASTMTSGHVQDINLTETTEADILSKLEAL